jgi:hypothetical protein
MSFGQNLESACKSYAFRTRVKTLNKIEELSTKANAMTFGSPEFLSIIAEIVKLEESIAWTNA